MKRILAFALAAVMAAGCFAGCGTKKDTESKAESKAKSKKWTIATDTVFKPFEYTDKDGNFVGIDVDIIKAVAEDQKFDYELKSLGWDA